MMSTAYFNQKIVLDVRSDPFDWLKACVAAASAVTSVLVLVVRSTRTALSVVQPALRSALQAISDIQHSSVVSVLS